MKWIAEVKGELGEPWAPLSGRKFDTPYDAFTHYFVKHVECRRPGTAEYRLAPVFDSRAIPVVYVPPVPRTGCFEFTDEGGATHATPAERS